jgi:hypothetical protein
MFILKKEAINFLNRYFKLPVSGDEQDWDIELADSDRVEEFLDAYDYDFSDDVKPALMALIFASYDDYIGEHKRDISIEAKIKTIVDLDRNLFTGLLKYWAVEGKEDIKKCFKVAAFARDILYQ